MGHGRCVDNKSVQNQPIGLRSRSDKYFNDSKNFNKPESTDDVQSLYSIDEDNEVTQTRKNILQERCIFFSYKQNVEETFEQFVSDLILQAEKCSFGNLLSDLVKCMIVLGARDVKVKEVLLQNSSLSLEKSVETCLLMEKNQHCLARALYDNIPDTPDELQFRRGDTLIVLEQNTANIEGWWLCSLRGKQYGAAKCKDGQHLITRRKKYKCTEPPAGVSRTFVVSVNRSCVYKKTIKITTEAAIATCVTSGSRK